VCTGCWFFPSPFSSSFSFSFFPSLPTTL
jgi:hypothetical protein